MRLIDQILLDVGDIKTCRQIRPFDLKELGYRFSKKKIHIKDTAYAICEILDEDKNKPVTFCLLLSKHSMMGIVLAFPFSKYFDLVKDDKKVKSTKEKSPDS